MLNPGLNATFSWLSQIASNYEYYTFNNVKLIYTTTSPTSIPGFVCFAFDADVTDNDPPSY